VGGDGQKMSKSLDNYIGITEEPSEIFRKLMKIEDQYLQTYFELCTDLTPEEINEVRAKGGPVGAHRVLAWIITLAYAHPLIPNSLDLKLYERAGLDWNNGNYHHPRGPLAGENGFFVLAYEQTAAAEIRYRAVAKGGIPDEMPEVTLAPSELQNGKIPIARLFTLVGLTTSNAEARRMVEQKGLRIDGEVLTDPKMEVALDKPLVLQRGKDKFVRAVSR
jgi:tyrosyl-tRNA synthetase